MSVKRIGILNGPNLNMLGHREVSIYGNIPFEKYLEDLRKYFNDIELLYFQSNIEGAIIDQLQEWQNTTNGIVLNAGAYTHTSIAIADCLAYIKVPVVEVHISNIYAREEFRRHSYLSRFCKGIIVGMGLEGYRYAIHYLLNRHEII